MKEKCGNCRYFESRGLMTGSTNWGLCTRITRAASANKESPYFRWEDDTCCDFETKKELSESHSHSEKAR